MGGIAEYLDDNRLSFVKDRAGDAATAAHCYVHDEAQADELIGRLKAIGIETAHKDYAANEALVVAVLKKNEPGYNRLAWNMKIAEPKHQQAFLAEIKPSGMGVAIGGDPKAGTGRGDL